MAKVRRPARRKKRSSSAPLPPPASPLPHPDDGVGAETIDTNLDLLAVRAWV